MKYGIINTLLIFFTTLITVIGLWADVEIALEAELADVITEPMVIAEDDLASNGEFIWMEGQPMVGGGGQGWAEFIINIPETGEYAVWGHVIAWDGNSDSFWVTWQPADPNENPQATNNNDFRWAVAGGSNWHWDRVNRWTDNDGTFDAMWEFDKVGDTVLRIGVREDATQIDAIFITSNADATNAAAANVRLPTDEDREIQIEGLAVDAKDKMTTTWGSLKKSYY